MDFLKLKLNLQFFAADDTGGSTPLESDVDETQPPKEDETPPVTFTQEQVDQMIKDRVARTEKEKAKAVEEAAKLAKMNADEKQKYEFEKLQKENDELKLEKNRYSLGREATKMLSESGISADDDVLDFVVREDAEATKQAVQAFSVLVQSKVDDAVKERLKGKSPKTASNPSGTITKEAIMSIKDTSQRIKAIQDNPQLFN